ncbi:hypothetical protein NGB36_04270 [Streptomyces sp. RB6PN25]|uniref:Uncharacterized protein n=1 Tax=Streptomyces humicola TaxID=2953240 RepID=A0ABT1PQ76_9ACTN|nr:hypothetical protein [Streptomyces humicola]MCQ4079826.1 hypothetical protein [Streptomyces humicola]
MSEHAAKGEPPRPRVEVAEFAKDTRYRLVRIGEASWEPLEREEFEVEVRRAYPDIDLHDAKQVHWADRPWEWPAWHQGEA